MQTLSATLCAGGMRNTGIEPELSSGIGLSQTSHEILEAIPADAGPRIGTGRGAVFYSVRPPGSQVWLPKHHFAGIMLAPARRVRATLGSDKLHEYDAPAGQLVINPAHVDSSLEWSSVRENAVVAITQSSLQELAEQEFGSENTELLTPPFGTIDMMAWTIAQLLKAELTRGEGGSELYADTLITLFGVHLLRNYTLRKNPTRHVKGGLGPDAARKVREYLNENFTHEISVNELATVAGLSPKHFIHSFTRTFGAAPHRYLVDLRLALAERLLVEGNMTIAEVAYLSGFSSHSHLTATMKKYRHVTPTQLRLSS